MFLRLFVPMFLICTLAFAGEPQEPEANFVPAGLELSEPGDSSAPTGTFGTLGANGGIATVIEAASKAQSLLPDFNFARGTDLSWDNWFSPSSKDQDTW